MSDDDAEQQLPLDEQPEQGFDAGDPAQVRRRETTQQIKEREADRFWRGIFIDPVGRREMWLLLEAAKPFEERFACGPNGFPQPEATWFNAGQQSLGLRIYQTWLAKFPDLVIEMQRENDPRFMPPPKKQRRKKDE
jgi:hypothetical protein